MVWSIDWVICLFNFYEVMYDMLSHVEKGKEHTYVTFSVFQ